MRRLVLRLVCAATLSAGGGCQTLAPIEDAQPGAAGRPGVAGPNGETEPVPVRPVGCPVPGATGYAYVNGYAAQRYTYPANLVRRAVLEAMHDMKMNSVHEEPRGDGLKLWGYLYDGRLICVYIEPCGEMSAMYIRIDWYGDEPQSSILIDRTSIRLATLLPPVNPVFAPRAYTDSVTHRGQDIAGYRGTPLR